MAAIAASFSGGNKLVSRYDMEKQLRLLYQLAGLYGVKITYRDTAGYRRQAGPHSILAVLRALGAPVETVNDVAGALREAVQKQYRRFSEPVAIAWDGKPASIDICLSTGPGDHSVECLLELENGEVLQWTCNPSLLPTLRSAEIEGAKYLFKKLKLPAGLPWGYHRCALLWRGQTYRVLIIAAPSRSYLPPAENENRGWGVFLPLYALRSKGSWASGDMADLRSLINLVQSLGGDFVGTLPLLAAFLDEPFEPSPYSPASRLFWNEFYLDITGVPELQQCPAALNLLNSPAFQKEIRDLRDAPLVDYRRGFDIKRKILVLLADCINAAASERKVNFQRWTAKCPMARDYARFRAAVEKQRAVWTKWPDRMRDGILREGDYDPGAEQYHLYVQWLAQEQFSELTDRANKQCPCLYLDLPLGVHPAGYDVWRERGSFALEASVGAPPDQLNTQGQNWNFSPLHPERIREQGYRYYIACLRQHLQHAGILRLDHVMGLHQLFWIPNGLAGNEGVYVKYRHEEFYAVLSLESHRYKTLLVGEDLGTVPDQVRASMARHKIYRMYVLPFSINSISRKGLLPAPARSLASLNTHDLPPFAAFWRDEKMLNRMGISLFLHRKGWLKAPVLNVKTILEGCLKHLAAGRSRILLVNLEDLWLETESQNIPGTQNEYPNWQRKARKDIEAFGHMPGMLNTLRGINKLRKRASINDRFKYN
jgi:4-alpha-glucanotransferase